MEWCNVKDGLPSFTSRAGNDLFVFVLGYSTSFGVGEYIYSSRTGWQRVGFAGVEIEVTHWMHLPPTPDQGRFEGLRFDGIELIDTETGMMVEDFEELMQEAGLDSRSRFDDVYVDRDGHVIIMDRCGNYRNLDDRYKPVVLL